MFLCAAPLHLESDTSECRFNEKAIRLHLPRQQSNENQFVLILMNRWINDGMVWSLRFVFLEGCKCLKFGWRKGKVGDVVANFFFWL